MTHDRWAWPGGHQPPCDSPRRVQAQSIRLEHMLFARKTDKGLILRHEGKFFEGMDVPVVASTRLRHEATH